MPFPLLASKSGLGHSEPASGIMGLCRLHQVRYRWRVLSEHVLRFGAVALHLHLHPSCMHAPPCRP